jgi:protease YdgD
MKSFIAAGLAAVLGLGLAGDVAGVSRPIGPGESLRFIIGEKQERNGGKPGMSRAPGSGNDSCRYANDKECDEPDLGTGACSQGTDRSDCRFLRTGETDSCRWARDGECDEPGLGTGACVQGSDRTDCGAVANLRFRNDSCATAFNNVCEEPGHGNGSCEVRTDRRDCIGAERPMTISDHFFGHDDRIFVDTNTYPWKLFGRLTSTAGGTCTASLIGRDVLITAAHCIHEDGRLDASGEFEASNGERARVTAYLISENFNYTRFIESNDIDGLDWAMLRIDRPLGESLGFFQAASVTSQGLERARAADLYQAGFAWDTGDHLSGHLGCHIVALDTGKNTFAHQCDTTRGDSGSPFLIRLAPDQYQVVGTDSSFRRESGQPTMNIAVSAAGWMQYLEPFRRGETGTPVGGRRSGARSKEPSR